MALPINGRQYHLLSVKGLRDLQVGDWTKQLDPSPIIGRTKSKLKTGKTGTTMENSLILSHEVSENAGDEIDSTNDNHESVSYVRK